MENLTENKKLYIQEMGSLFVKLLSLHLSDNDREKKWLLEKSLNLSCPEVIQGMTLIAWHILDAVGKYEPINTINIARKTKIPKGTVSKNIRKLGGKNLLAKSLVANNKKEREFYLTPLGKELFLLHSELHQEMDQQSHKYFAKYSEEELQFIVQFLADTTNFFSGK